MASFLGGGVTLDRPRAEQVLYDHKGLLSTAEEFAAGILRVVETTMEKAIRVISIERGHDPRQFTLVAFGGGGPLHACSLARALHIPTVLIPAMPGALSAVGILLADTVRDYSRTVMLSGDEIGMLGEHFGKLEDIGQAEFADEGLCGQVQFSADLRYRHQGYELNVPWDPANAEDALKAFHLLHKQSYGFSDQAREVEIVNVRLRMVAEGEPYAPSQQELTLGDGSAAVYGERPVFFDGDFVPTSLYRREVLKPGDKVRGPALITEYTSATVLPTCASASVDRFRNLIIQVSEGYCQ
jgi:N-methylhydantoinase A